MRFNTTALAALCAATTMFASFEAGAVITRHTTLAGFLSAASSVGTDTFDDLSTAGNSTIPVTRSAGAISYRLSGGGLRGLQRSGSDVWATTTTLAGTFSVNTFSQPVYAIGAYFYLTDAGGAITSSIGNANVTDSAGANVALNVFNATGPYFVGFTSTLPLTGVFFSSSSIDRATINDLMLGGSAAPVPEPSAAALLMLGGAGLMVWRRRRPQA